MEGDDRNQNVALLLLDNCLHSPFDVITCGVHVVQVHVKGWSRCQKYKLVKVVKLCMSDRFGECVATLMNKEKRFS